MNIGNELICPMCKGNNWKMVYLSKSMVIRCWLCKYHAEYLTLSNSWKVLSFGSLEDKDKE